MAKITIRGVECVFVPYKMLEGYQREKVDAGYHYGCLCGESFKSPQQAKSCKKCGPDMYVFYTPPGMRVDAFGAFRRLQGRNYEQV